MKYLFSYSNDAIDGAVSNAVGTASIPSKSDLSTSPYESPLFLQLIYPFDY